MVWHSNFNVKGTLTVVREFCAGSKYNISLLSFSCSAGCHAYAFVGSVASFVSINTLAAIAVDRCLVIVKIMKLHNRPSRTYFYMAIAIIWIYSVIWGAVPIVGWGKYILEGTNTSCTFDFLTRSVSNRLYVTTIFLAHFVVPVSIIICSYYLIFQTVSKHRREFDKAARIFGEERVPFSVRKHYSGIKNELKTAKVSIIVILVFCVSWFPYATVALIGEFGDAILVTRLASGIPCLCAKFSTVVNPLIYALLHPKFRVRLFSMSTCSELNRLQNHSSMRRDTIWCRTLRMSSEQKRLSQIEESDTV